MSPGVARLLIRLGSLFAELGMLKMQRMKGAQDKSEVLVVQMSKINYSRDADEPINMGA
jgi:hypothetical protein